MDVCFHTNFGKSTVSRVIVELEIDLRRKIPLGFL